MIIKRNIRLIKIVLFLVFNLIFTILLGPFIIFWGPFDYLKQLAVGSIEQSRHPQVLDLFLSETQILEIIHANEKNINLGITLTKEKTISTEGITIEDIDIKGRKFKGKVMIIKDPKRVKIAVTKELGVTGQRVSDLVKNAGAIAGINAGGFYDPNGKGNGAYPDGITIHNGETIHNNVGNSKVTIAGIDKNGKLVIGNFTETQIKEKNIMEAVTFEPVLILDGKPQIYGDGGKGIAPRTGIGQTADGSIIFVVIDGRQPTWSTGATISELMNVFIDYHAVNAINLDGGSSTELVYNGKVMNRLWNIFGERYIPTAFVVMP
jgi:Exopolysaccharide biosynthesis protein related to N-acetylglucosamine-1-phosphodiester alpha-N-acetylglucosaminidase